MLLNMAATSALGCARCGFTITAADIADGLPLGADGRRPDVEWVVVALPLLMDRARRDGKTFLCADCARQSGHGVNDEIRGVRRVTAVYSGCMFRRNLRVPQAR